jgi:hypothetical protein
LRFFFHYWFHHNEEIFSALFPSIGEKEEKFHFYVEFAYVLYRDIIKLNCSFFSLTERNLAWWREHKNELRRLTAGENKKELLILAFISRNDHLYSSTDVISIVFWVYDFLSEERIFCNEWKLYLILWWGCCWVENAMVGYFIFEVMQTFSC